MAISSLTAIASAMSCGASVPSTHSITFTCLSGSRSLYEIPVAEFAIRRFKEMRAWDYKDSNASLVITRSARISIGSSTFRNPMMIKFTVLGAAAILSTMIATPVFAQAAVQEPGLNAFYESLGVVGSGPGPMPWPSPRSSYGAIDHSALNRWSASCSQRYRSYDLASGTFRGYDGIRHPCQ